MLFCSCIEVLLDGILEETYWNNFEFTKIDSKMSSKIIEVIF
jgi:hypothetical protein